MTGTSRTPALRRTGARTLGLLVLLVTALTAAAPGVIRIRPGDTLSALALRHHTTVAQLQAANHLHGTVLLLGQHLTYAVTVSAPAPGTTSSAAPGVAASAARHRAVLADRSVPSRAQVKALIRAAARRHGVPADLALALAWQESGFQQRVVSPVDAIGVMQVLPSTGRSLGRMHGRHFDLLKASDNVEAGVWLLRDLLDATGSASGAMAGYYQGLGSVARIGLLPETRAYIRNITVLRARFS